MITGRKSRVFQVNAAIGVRIACHIDDTAVICISQGRIEQVGCQHIAQMVCRKDRFYSFFREPVIGHPCTYIVDQAIYGFMPLGDLGHGRPDIPQKAQIRSIYFKVNVGMSPAYVVKSYLSLLLITGDKQHFSTVTCQMPGCLEANTIVGASDDKCFSIRIHSKNWATKLHISRRASK